MKKVIVYEDNAERFVVAIKGKQAIGFTDDQLSDLGIDIYKDQISPMDFDFDEIVANNAEIEIHTPEDFEENAKVIAEYEI